MFVGIDAGVSGALAAVGRNGCHLVADLPIVEGDLKQVNPRGLLDLLREAVPADEKGMVVIEDIRVRQFKGRVMSHTTETVLVGMRFAIEAVAGIAGMQVHVVQPSSWKKHYGLLGTDKTASLDKARAIYPALQPFLKRQKDNNRAEAMLIARWGLNHLA